MKCERCSNEAVKKERYCKHCRKVVMTELSESGYLTSRPYTPYRSGEKRQASSSESSPWDENAVRALEEDR